MHQLSSFGVRLVLTVLATATISITAFVVLSVFRLESGLDQQITELERLSETKLERRLNSVTALAEARLRLVFDEAERQLANIAQARDVVQAVESRNHVAMFEVLGPKAKRANLDGILVLDSQLAPIGAESDSVDLLAANQALRNLPLAESIRDVFIDNYRSEPKTFETTVSLDSNEALAVGSAEPIALAALIVEPLFDDFGDVVAVLVGRRELRQSEDSLANVAELEDVGFIIVSGDKVISSAGTKGTPSRFVIRSESSMFMTPDEQNWARCASLFGGEWTICACAAAAELRSLRDEMARIGQSEGRSLAIWLVLAAMGALAVCGAATFFLANRLTGPMARITEAVRQVAHGDWKTEVVGTERRDEIGEIARAVVTLQHSLEERDRLRTTAATARQADEREEVLRSAIQEFDHGMRSLLLATVSNLELIDETSKDLAGHWGHAESEADEALFIAERMSIRINAVEEAAVALRTSIEEIRGAVDKLGEMIAPHLATSVEGKQAEAHAIAALTESLESAVERIDTLAQGSGLMGMQARFSSLSGAPDDGDLRELATTAATLSQGLSEAVDSLRSSIRAIKGVGEQAARSEARIKSGSSSLAAIADDLDRHIVGHAESLEAVSSNLQAACDGFRNIASSVERLKQTVVAARGSSLHVETSVTKMTNEAHSFDRQMKELLQRVVG